MQKCISNSESPKDNLAWMEPDKASDAVEDSMIDHLQAKWKNFLDFFDSDNDQQLTKADMLFMSNRLIREAGNLLSESGAFHVRRQYQHWLTTQEKELCEVGPGEITASVMADKLTQLLTNNAHNKHLFKELDIFSEIFFDIVDINRDGKISRTELGVFYKTVGIKNENVIDLLLHVLDLVGDGNVTREEFRIAYREYFFGDQRKRNKHIALLFDKAGLLNKQREMFYSDD